MYLWQRRDGNEVYTFTFRWAIGPSTRTQGFLIWLARMARVPGISLLGGSTRALVLPSAWQFIFELITVFHNSLFLFILPLRKIGRWRHGDMKWVIILRPRSGLKRRWKRMLYNYTKRRKICTSLSKQLLSDWWTKESWKPPTWQLRFQIMCCNN